jgi:glutamate-1-semialdehyde 2,1-aminomutase
MNNTLTAGESRTRALNERAWRVLPGGNTRLNAFELPLPTYASRGEGYWLHDVEGRQYVDFVNNFTTLLHGHAFAPINEALSAQMARGLSYGVGTEHEIKLAELVAERMPAIETLRFANSGTEAVMYALKAARAFTGKAGIARCEGAWHGGYDWAEISTLPTPAVWGNDPRSLPTALNTPQQVIEDVTVIPFNNAGWTERILTQRLASIGAILVDPLPSRIGMIPIAADYAAFLNTFARKHGILIIADEVLCNRIGFAGASAVSGLEPDLVTLGKIYGGGLPIGIFGGRAEIMSVFDPSRGPAVPHSGTFIANPMTMVAGHAAISAWTPEAVERLNRLGQGLRDDLNSRFQRLGANASVTGSGSLFKIHPKREQPLTYREGYPTPAEAARLKTLIAVLKEHGYMLMSTGGGCLSTPMDSKVLKDFADVVEEWATRDEA